MENQFTNEKRNRYYGLRVGDLVSPKTISGEEWHKGESVVVAYGFMNNNSVRIKAADSTEVAWVAEWCEIIKKVEDQ